MPDTLTTYEVDRYVVQNEVLLIDAENEAEAKEMARSVRPRTARTQYSETVEVEEVVEVRD
jgi:hypothetical protein